MEPYTLYDFTQNWPKVVEALKNPQLILEMEFAINELAMQKGTAPFYRQESPPCMYLSCNLMTNFILKEVGYFEWLKSQDLPQDGPINTTKLREYYKLTRYNHLAWIMCPSEEWVHGFLVKLAAYLEPQIAWGSFKLYARQYIVTDIYQRYIFDPISWYCLQKKNFPLVLGNSVAYEQFAKEDLYFQSGFDGALCENPELYFLDSSLSWSNDPKDYSFIAPDIILDCVYVTLQNRMEQLFKPID